MPEKHFEDRLNTTLTFQRAMRKITEPKDNIVCSKFKVQGLKCNGCVQAWRKQLMSVVGITDVAFDISTASISVFYDTESLKLNDIVDALNLCSGASNIELANMDTMKPSHSNESDNSNSCPKQHTAKLVLCISHLTHELSKQNKIRTTHFRVTSDRIMLNIQQIKGVIYASIAPQLEFSSPKKKINAIYLTILYNPRIIGARHILQEAKNAASSDEIEIKPDTLFGDTILQLEAKRLGNILYFCIPIACVVFYLMLRPVTSLPLTLRRTYLGIKIKDYLITGLSFFVYGFAGYRFHKKALEGLRLGCLTMDFLVSLSTTFTIFHTILFYFVQIVLEKNQQALGILPTSYYNEAPPFNEMPALVLTFMLVGQLLEAQTRILGYRLVHNSLPKGHDLYPCWVESNTGTMEQIPACLLEIGDIVRIAPGDTIQHDGVLHSNTTIYVDESLITGESFLNPKLPQNPLYGGSKVASCGASESALYSIKAIGSETYMGQLEKFVLRRNKNPGRLESFSNTLLQYFVPFVFCLSLCTGITWTLLFVFHVVQPWNSNPYDSVFFVLQSMSAVLAVACPCALGLANSTTMACGVSRAASFGALIRNVDALEAMAKPMTDIIFDKTGTLTSKHNVTPYLVADALTQWPLNIDILPYDTDPTILMVWLALSVQPYDSQHLVTTTLIRIWAEQMTAQHFPLPKPQQATLYENEGVVGIVDLSEWISNAQSTTPPSSTFHVHVAVGNSTCMIRHHVDLHHYHDANAYVYISCNYRCIGYIDLRDVIKPEAREVLEFFKERHQANIWICTGDTQQRAQSLATELGIDLSFVKYKCTPLEKAQLIRSIKNSSKNPKRIMMVGDGVNDAPSIAEATIGIVLGTEAHLTSTCADIVLLKDSLRGLMTLITFCKFLKRKIYFNFFWSIVFNLLALPVAAGIFHSKIVLTPTWSGCSMAASSLLVVLNSASVLLVPSFELPFSCFLFPCSLLSHLYKIFHNKSKAPYEKLASTDLV